MNDYTKEELKLLGGCVFSKFIASLNDPSIHHLQNDLKNIRNKIDFMIDNYCEHDVCAIDYDHQAVRCKSCKEIVE
ncbi:hypothetical protein SDA16_06930 [Legionella pneumophila serogroup 1]|uniref:Uncharacterized protein n=1 Tax=Legionella pneumophila TaxID=446 RepID=A0A140AYM6_LEGPN|nr:hypothetical protein [Legionella pneumophila]HCC3235838.1 hypothetical protein [Legionella pneumophila subsp. pneumophila]ALK43923.1 hypothetical protein [Legionella pneumophila]HAT2149820.1 hypothetical protein [Legionella pneumophila]HAT8621024.1 hypothetical protein [Legionella pneumophila]HAT8730854.1 hypothetical protein [Legionella pneumophila]